jgi:RND family efflux transporter MFP subunit
MNGSDEPRDGPAGTADAGRRRRIIFVVGALVVVALVLVLYFRKRSAQPAGAAPGEAEVVVGVRVARAERRPIAADSSTIGTIFAREQATVAPKVGGQIVRMRLLKNAVVQKGEVIAQLETPDRDIRDARANLETARALYERRRALYAQGGIALREVEAARLALTTAENTVRLAEDRIGSSAADGNPAGSRGAPLTYASVRAPISGVVTDQFQFQGEFAAAGAKLVTIADMSQVIVKAQVADNVVAQVRVGDAVAVLLADQPDALLSGRISLISRSSDPVNRTVEVWVNLGNPAGRLRAGGAAKVVVATKQTNDAIVVPASAVTLDAPNKNTGAVMVVGAGNVAHETRVTVGIRTPEAVQVTSGLKGGETVVTEGNYALPDGSKVEINTSEVGAELSPGVGTTPPAGSATAPSASPGTPKPK